MSIELKLYREQLKNVAGMDRHGKELSQIRKGEVMFLDKTEPAVVSVISLKKDQALICYFLCCLLSASVHSIIFQKEALKLMLRKLGLKWTKCGDLIFLLKEQGIPKM